MHTLIAGACHCSATSADRRLPAMVHLGQGVLFRTVGFYMTPIVLLIAIASIALAAWCYRSQFKVASLAAVLVGMGIAILVGRTILAKTENTAHLEKRLEGARSKTGSHKVQS
jgi:hypothetical protein